jgi:peptide-methionine (S)-S-oxide reductase
MKRVTTLAAGILLVMLSIGFAAGSMAQTAAQPQGATSMATASSASAVATSSPILAKAVFAGGCFWCVESDFDKVPGVISTTSGYTGGRTANPSYEQVSSHSTGHAEAVEVVYDKSKVSYERLLEYYWHTIDPTVRDQQFCDRGTPYRTAIFPVDAEQMNIALASRAALEESKPFKEPIQTEITAATAFYPAEEYHQDYYKKNPIRYKYYRASCGRDARVKQLWGSAAAGH